MAPVLGACRWVDLGSVLSWYQEERGVNRYYLSGGPMWPLPWLWWAREINRRHPSHLVSAPRQMNAGFGECSQLEIVGSTQKSQRKLLGRNAACMHSQGRPIGYAGRKAGRTMVERATHPGLEHVEQLSGLPCIFQHILTAWCLNITYLYFRKHLGAKTSFSSLSICLQNPWDTAGFQGVYWTWVSSSYMDSG